MAMNADKAYITQLTKDDLRAIAEVANLKVELPLKLERSGGAARLFIDERKLKDMLWCFVSQIVSAVTVTRANAPNLSFDTEVTV